MLFLGMAHYSQMLRKSSNDAPAVEAPEARDLAYPTSNDASEDDRHADVETGS